MGREREPGVSAVFGLTPGRRAGFCPEGVGELVREGLRSGPKTGHLGCVRCTVCTGFAAGSRQFADERSVARSAHIMCTHLIAQVWARLALAWCFLQAPPLGCRWFRP
ncbi:hypothetical protein GIW32_20310 [Pseudomonas syringae]|nr:hypothetical protein [Pseudomonas syringae]MCF5243345.1 hypothetical protein [Pseudomonas syringae]